MIIMESDKKNYLDFFNKTAYIPPNDISYGYAEIGPMLYIFPRIAVHSPAGGAIGNSLKHYPKTTLKIEEFEKLFTSKDNKIRKTLLIPTAFETFTQDEYRQNLPVSFKIICPFDRKIVDESSLLFEKLKIIPDKRFEVAQKAIKMLELIKSKDFESQIIGQLKHIREYSKIEETLNNYRDPSGTPSESIQLILDINDPAQRVVAYSISSYINNNLASKTGTSELDVLSIQDRIITESINGIKPAFNKFKSLYTQYLSKNQTIEEEVVHAVLYEVCKIREDRININHLLEFRENYRESFLKEIYVIFDEVSKIENHDDKVVTATEMAKKLTDFRMPKIFKDNISRIIYISASGLAKEKETTNGLNKSFNLSKKAEHWSFGLNSTQPKSRVTKKTKSELIDVFDKIDHK